MNEGRLQNELKNVERKLVFALQEHITSLEKQLSDKQQIIESLLHTNKNHDINNKRDDRSIKKIQNGNNTQVNKTISISNNNSQDKPTNIKSNLITSKTIKSNLKSNENDNIIIKKQNNSKPSENKKKQKNIKKSVVVIGDSIINNIEARGLGNKHHVKVKPFSGASSDDMKDFIKPSIRLKPDVVILHVGTNDLTRKEIDTVKNLEQIHKYIKDESPNTKLIISTLTTRNDRDDIENVVTKSNDVICSFCRRHDINIVDNNNIESQHLGLKKLHLNRKGTSLLALNFKNYIENL